MPRSLRHAVRGSLAFAVLGLSLSVFTAGTAHAATTTETTWSETYDIEIGQDREVIGTVTLTRTNGATPALDDQLTVEYAITAANRTLDEWQLCVSSEPFTTRDLGPNCQHKDESPLNTGVFIVPIPATGTVYVQFHFASDNDTGFIGWMPGNPFYGNVAVLDVPFVCAGDEEAMTDLNEDDVINQADCDFEALVVCDDAETVAIDTNGNGIADRCEPNPVVCDDAETVAIDTNGNGIADTCVPVKVFCPDTNVEITDATDANGNNLADMCEAPVVLPDTGTTAPEAPAAPVEETVVPAEEPVAPAVTPVLVEVLDDTATPAVAPAVVPAATDTAVLGAQVQRTQLARTGAATPGLVAVGALFVLMGAGMALIGKELADA